MRLEWLNRRRNEDQPIERQLLDRVGGSEQVTYVGRIERPAEDPEPREPSQVGCATVAGGGGPQIERTSRSVGNFW